MTETIFDVMWAGAKVHFDQVQAQYEALQSEPGVNTSFALMYVFAPLERRFESGERTQELYDEMMSVE